MQAPMQTDTAKASIAKETPEMADSQSIPSPPRFLERQNKGGAERRQKAAPQRSPHRPIVLSFFYCSIRILLPPIRYSIPDQTVRIMAIHIRTMPPGIFRISIVRARI